MENKYDKETQAVMTILGVLINTLDTSCPPLVQKIDMMNILNSIKHDIITNYQGSFTLTIQACAKKAIERTQRNGK